MLKGRTIHLLVEHKRKARKLHAFTVVEHCTQIWAGAKTIDLWPKICTIKNRIKFLLRVFRVLLGFSPPHVSRNELRRQHGSEQLISFSCFAMIFLLVGSTTQYSGLLLQLSRFDVAPSLQLFFISQRRPVCLSP